MAAATPKVINAPIFRAQVASERLVAEHWDGTKKAIKGVEGNVLTSRVRPLLGAGEGIFKATWAIVASVVTTVFWRKCRSDYYRAVKDQLSSVVWCTKATIKPNWALRTLLYTHKFKEPGYLYGENDKAERRFAQGSYNKTPYGTPYDPQVNTWRSKWGITGKVWFTSKV